MKKLFSFLLIFLCLAPPVLALPGNELLKSVESVTLKNGMKFLLLKRSGVPVFSAYLRVKVGGIDEAPGQTGVAHLLEHMAFKGTREIGTRQPEEEAILLEKIEKVHAKKLQARGAQKKALEKELQDLLKDAAQYVVSGEFSKIYERNGATDLNATTSQDLTTYFVTLPANKLKLWAYLESARLKDPVFREFYQERDVVQEERRMRVEDSPFGKLYEVFVDLAFEKSPYRRPTIGYPADLVQLSATQLRTFYEKYYVPENMVGAIVGDIDVPATKALLAETFGTIPKGVMPPGVKVVEPEPRQTKRVSVPFKASPAIILGYLKPSLPHTDDYAFDVLNQILCEGPTSRLYRSLVEEKRLVQRVDCSPSVPGSRLDNLFLIYASIRQGVSPQAVTKAIEQVFKTLELQGVEEEELKRAKKNILSQWYFDLQSNSDIADSLSFFESITGDWHYILEHPEKINQVSSKQLQDLIKKYLRPERLREAVLKAI